MAWSIHYRIRYDHSWTEEDKAKLREHSDRWNEKLSLLSSGYDVRGLPEKRDYQGSTKAAPSPRAANDYVTVVSALRELEMLFPGLEATVSDESEHHRHARPQDIDLRELRQAVLEEWGDPKGRYADSEEAEDPDEELRRAEERMAGESEDTEPEAGVEPPAVPGDLRSETQALLKRAAKDFEIWKKAQREKAGKGKG